MQPQEEKQLRQVLRPVSIPFIAMACVLGIGASVLIWKTDVIPAKANYATTRAVVRGWANDFPGAIAKFKVALSYNVPGIYEYRHRFAQYLLEYTMKNKLTSESQEAVLYGISEVSKNVVESHQDYLPYLYLSRLNIVLGKEDPKSPYNDAALLNSMKALEISPTFVRTYYEIGQAYLNKKDNTTAAKYFQKAIALNPEVGLSYWYLGMTIVDEGNLAKGMPLLRDAVDKSGSIGEGDFLRLVPPLLKANDYTNLVWMYEQLTKLKPKNATYFASLAFAYAKIGKIDEAVTAARQTVLIDSKYMKEAQAFVRSLGREL
jgi:tetratricopeptide (TPR) repeat protein